jgi:hypothetical protein
MWRATTSVLPDPAHAMSCRLVPVCKTAACCAAVSAIGDITTMGQTFWRIGGTANPFRVALERRILTPHSPDAAGHPDGRGVRLRQFSMKELTKLPL